MIVIDPNATFDMPVRVNKKGFIAQFGMKFKLLDQDQLSDLMKRWMGEEKIEAAVNNLAAIPSVAADEKAPIAEAPILISNLEFIGEVAVDWTDVSDPDGLLSFSKKNLKRLCKRPGVTAAIIAAFQDGYSEADEKNLLAQPAI